MSNSELERKILDQISKTGFPLELRVADYLQNNGYYVASNLCYIDRDEGKGREIDLRALNSLNLGFSLKEQSSPGFPSAMVCNCLLIECKKSENPWVIFSSPENLYDKLFIDVDCRGLVDDSLLDTEMYGELEKVHPYATNKLRGRSHYEPFKDHESSVTIFKALISAAKATISNRDGEFSAGHQRVCFYYPLVVFDGNLYEANLDKGKICLNETDIVLVSFFYTSANYKEEQFIITIVTEKGLPAFCLALQQSLSILGQYFTRHPDRIQAAGKEYVAFV